MNEDYMESRRETEERRTEDRIAAACEAQCEKTGERWLTTDCTCIACEERRAVVPAWQGYAPAAIKREGGG